MPLRDKCDKENRSSTIAFNIRELLSAWEETGAINGDKIRTRKEALRRATGIAMSICNKDKEMKRAENFNNALDELEKTLEKSSKEWKKYLELDEE